MSKYAVLLKTYLEKLVEGDYSAAMSPALLSRKGEIGQIARLVQRIGKNTAEQIDRLDKLACGDPAPALSTGSDHDLLGKSVAAVARKISSLSEETGSIAAAMAQGETQRKADTTGFVGCYSKILEDINFTCDSLNAPLKDVMDVLVNVNLNDFSARITNDYLGDAKVVKDTMNEVCDRLSILGASITKIANGDTSDLKKYMAIGPRSEQDHLIPAMIQITSSIENLELEAGRLAEDTLNGKVIGNQCDTSKLEGKYKTIIDGFNNTLSAISKPMEEIHSVVACLSVNDFTRDIEGNYKGDFKDIADAVTAVSERLRYLEKTAVKIAKGDISELEKLKAIGKRSENDHLLPSFVRMMESIQGLLTESEALADAAENGNFEYRSDESQFEGDFKSIISSLDAMFANISFFMNEEAEIFSAMSAGKLNVSMKKDYKGLLGQLAEDINKTASTLNGITNEISGVLTEISNGNLALDQVSSYQGDFAAISDALNTILRSLNDVMGAIKSASEQVASGSAQVSLGSQSLSQGATEQASSVEELTASITEISTQTKTNAEDANKANTLATTVKKNAQAGKAQMNDMLQAVEDLKVSSNKISKIIKTIDDIAFQTNILALNAAVEAARAGQAGKGFAVVAEEVRNLAARSAKASSETTALIEETISKVEYGTQITGKTAKALGSILDGIDEVDTLIGKIATASNEQATGLSQIDKGIMQVSQVIQTNSATAEESAAASEELSGQAETLKTKVTHFNLRSEAQHAAAPVQEKAADAVPAQKDTPVKISLDDTGFGKY